MNGAEQMDQALQESEERFRHAFENANIGVCLVNTEGHFIRVNNRLCEIVGYSKEELEGMTVNDISHPQDKEISPEFFRRSISGEIESTTYEKRYIHKQGHLVWGQISTSLVRNPEGNPFYFISHVQDITNLKKAEEALQNAHDELALKNIHLEEANTALRALLREQDREKAEIEEKIVANVNQLVLPYLDKMNAGLLKDQQKANLSIALWNLNEIISPFAQRLSSRHLDLTPSEIRVADLVRNGKCTKEIANLLSLAKGTIDRHRENIRTKLGIKNQRASLRTHLESLQ